MKRISALIVTLGILLLQTAFSQEPLFRDGDRVCFIGSSIAMNGANAHYINLFYATRYPERKITFINSGISGDVTDDILKRMDSDILINRPTWAVLMLEENDLRPNLYYKSRQNEPGIMEKRQKALQNWFNNAETIIQKLQQAHIKVILQTPTIYDQTGDLSAENAYGLNDSLQRCVAHLKKLGTRYNLPVVDCWTMMNEINQHIQSKDPKQSIIGNDRVHVSKMGYFVMVYQFLKTLPVLERVSHTVIDARRKKIDQQFNCTVSNLKTGTKDISFTYLGKSLPYPSPDRLNVDSLHAFTGELNADVVQVKGLPSGNYKLLIDTVMVGVFSDKTFEKGINLSGIKNTPQYQQAGKVLKLFNNYWETERTLRVMKYVEYSHLANSGNKEDMDAVSKTFAEILERSRDSANYGFFKNVFNTYTTNKPSEKDLISRQEKTLNAIQDAAIPVQHTYKIEQQ